MSLEEAAKLAPIATASIAFCALIVAMISIITQKAVARKRAAIDVFFKTEMDKEMPRFGRGGAISPLWMAVIAAHVAGLVDAANSNRIHRASLANV